MDTSVGTDTVTVGSTVPPKGSNVGMLVPGNSVRGVAEGAPTVGSMDTSVGTDTVTAGSKVPPELSNVGMIVPDSSTISARVVGAKVPEIGFINVGSKVPVADVTNVGSTVPLPE
jgi:hypothetical protein